MRRFKFLTCCLLVLSTLLLLTTNISTIYAETSSSTDGYSYTNSDTGYRAAISDDAGFLTDSDKNSLISLMKDTTDYCNILIATTTDHTYSSTESYAVHTLEDNFGADSMSVAFVIDRDLNEIYLTSEGDARHKISSSKCNTICDNTYVYATSSHNYDYYTCCYKTIEQVNTTLQGNRIAQPMRYISSAFLAIAIGMILCFLYALKVSKGKQATTTQLLSGAFTKVDITNTNVSFTHQTKQYSPRQTSSNGGGGGHSSGGHSGGGHHI